MADNTALFAALEEMANAANAADAENVEAVAEEGSLPSAVERNLQSIIGPPPQLSPPKHEQLSELPAYLPPPPVAHPSRPSEPDIVTPLLAITASIIAIAAMRYRSIIMKTVQERAALVICCGLAVMAFSLFVASGHRDFQDIDRLQKFMDRGWVTMFGAAVTLVGLYHWIAGGQRR